MTEKWPSHFIQYGRHIRKQDVAKGASNFYQTKEWEVFSDLQNLPVKYHTGKILNKIDWESKGLVITWEN